MSDQQDGGYRPSSYSTGSHSVGAVARLAGVTVRTLHHYDAIGLLTPSGRTAAGYRSYSEDDLDRLRRILTYRELGFCLDDIADILADGDATAHLRRQHDLLMRRIEQFRRMAAAVELELEATTMGLQLTGEEKFELFGEHDPDSYADEVQQRWGGTDAYEQSRRRTKSYTKQDWQTIKGELIEIQRGLAEALADGAAPDSERAMDLVEAHRRHIHRWFYDCSHEMQQCLGEMYVADSRFTETYEREVGPGGAEFVRDAISANAQRANAERVR